MLESYMLVKNAMCYGGSGWKMGSFPSLSLLLCKLQGVTSCSGALTMSWGESSITVNGKRAGTILRPNLDILLQEASAAPFGRGEQTVYDANVRNGLQIKEINLEISNIDDLIPEGIQELAPTCYKMVPKLYKMHIYTPGGHFNTHRDSVHADNHLGTLIVALPSKFKGGELTLMDHKEEKTFSLQAKGEKMINWVAFYTDIRHRVEPVLSGVRAVLQFDLLVVPKTERIYSEDRCQEESWTSQQRNCGDTASLVALSLELKKQLEMNPKQKFALILKHKYTLRSLKAELLKNVDEALWKHLESSFDVSLTPVLIHEEGDNQNTSSDLYVNPFDEQIIMREGKEEESSKSVIPSRGSRRKEIPTWVVTGSQESEYFHLDSLPYLEYIGNEAQHANDKYVVSCLVVHKIK